ncbi:MAG: DUF7282 domain-containing protein [Patescibacteria group bacterium]
MDGYEKNQGSSFLDSMGSMKYLVFALVTILILLFFFWVTASDEEANREGEEVDPAEENQEEQETDEEQEMDEANDQEESDQDLSKDEEDSIEVADQEAGDAVFVSDMDLTESRWIVVHEDRDGELGNILGARLFPATANDGSVNLLRETEEGKSYYAVLYKVAEREKDKGRRFDASRDVPLIKEGGEMKKVLFSVE